MGWFVILSDPQGNPFAIWRIDPKAKQVSSDNPYPQEEQKL
jgi:hypothetical protein